MKTVERQKICSNCDGRIAIDAKECIYCGAEQAKPTVGSSPPKPTSLQDSLASLYAPPYSSKANNLFGNEAQNPSQGAPQPMKHHDTEAREDKKGSFYPVVFFMTAGMLFTLGLIQLFFSDNGVLRLEWNSSYWFLYCLIALPLFYLGLKKMNQLQE